MTRLQALLVLSALVMGGFAEGEEAIAPEAPAANPDARSWLDMERGSWLRRSQHKLIDRIRVSFDTIYSDLQPLLGDEREVDALKKLNETIRGVERKDPETVREEDYRDIFHAALHLADQLRQIPRHMEHHKSRDAVEALKALNFWAREVSRDYEHFHPKMKKSDEAETIAEATLKVEIYAMDAGDQVEVAEYYRHWFMVMKMLAILVYETVLYSQ